MPHAKRDVPLQLEFPCVCQLVSVLLDAPLHMLPVSLLALLRRLLTCLEEEPNVEYR